MTVTVPEQYELPVSAPITSERQHEHYLSVPEKLAGKQNPTPEKEKYVAVLLTLVEAYEEEHHSIPDASRVEVLHAFDGGPQPSSERSGAHFWLRKHRLRRFHLSPAVFF